MSIGLHAYILKDIAAIWEKLRKLSESLSLKIKFADLRLLNK
jgi:hypothetical protein